MVVLIITRHGNTRKCEKPSYMMSQLNWKSFLFLNAVTQERHAWLQVRILLTSNMQTYMQRYPSSVKGQSCNLCIHGFKSHLLLHMMPVAQRQSFSPLKRYMRAKHLLVTGSNPVRHQSIVENLYNTSVLLSGDRNGLQNRKIWVQPDLSGLDTLQGCQIGYRFSMANSKNSEFNRYRDDLFCSYCHRQCKSLNSLKQHETRCVKNPDMNKHACGFKIAYDRG